MRRLLLTPIILIAATASAQTHWLNPVSGNWSNPANWTPTDVPDTAGESAMIDVAGAYTIEWDLTASLGGLTISEPGATVTIGAGRALYYSGAGLQNDGQILINPTGSNTGTLLRLDTPASTLTGVGVLRLNANDANSDTAHLGTLNGGFVLTNAAGHEVAGTGRIRVAFSNEGLVSADVPGRLLDIHDHAKWNSGTMQAIDGATLQFNAVGVANAGGLITADGAGSIVQLSGSTIAGGTISSVNDGIVESSNSRLDGVLLEGTLNVTANSTTYLNGNGIVNEGTLTINPSGANAGTLVRIDAPAIAIDGAGTIALNANAANLDTAHLGTLNGGFTLTLGAAQTVRGTGRIRTRTTNNGTIQADVGGAVLDIHEQPKTNNGVMRAIDGGVLQLSSVNVDNTAGQIRAEADSFVTLAGAGVTGGLLEGVDGGIVSSWNSAINGVTIGGQMHVNGNTATTVHGNFTNEGDLTINPTAANAITYVRLDAAAATLDGTGTVHLNANPANLDTAHLATLNGGYVLTLGPDQTVDGTGRVRVRFVNEGTIDANVAGAILEIHEHPKINNALMRASAGGTLGIGSVGVTNNGQIRSEGAGSAVSIYNAAVTGGSLEAVDGAVNAVQNSSFADVTIEGPLAISANGWLSVLGGGVTNNDVVTLNPTASDALTYIRLDVAAATLAGDGVLRLNAHAANLDTAHLTPLNGAYVLTNAASHTIAGTGRIRGRLNNLGLVEADVAGATLDVHDHPKTNAGTMRARNGGTLSLSNVAVANTGGAIVAADAASTVSLVNASVTGGTIAAVNGAATHSANSTFNGVTFDGAHNVSPNSTLLLREGGITNDGILTVNTTAANALTYIRLDVPTATIDGNGEIRLNADPANLDTAHLTPLNGAYQLQLGPAQTLSGNGRVRVRTVNAGRLSPGTPADRTGVIDLQAPHWVQTSESQLAIDLGGPAPDQYDRITGNSPVVLDGALLVGLVDGYLPPYGSQFPIVTCGSRTGTFADIVAPALGGDDRWRVHYTANSATLVVTCDFDLDGDFAVGLADLTVLLAHFGMTSGALERDGDLDSDGDVDLQDLADLLSRFGTACN